MPAAGVCQFLIRYSRIRSVFLYLGFRMVLLCRCYYCCRVFVIFSGSRPNGNGEKIYFIHRVQLAAEMRIPFLFGWFRRDEMKDNTIYKYEYCQFQFG